MYLENQREFIRIGKLVNVKSVFKNWKIKFKGYHLWHKKDKLPKNKSYKRYVRSVYGNYKIVLQESKKS